MIIVTYTCPYFINLWAYMPWKKIIYGGFTIPDNFIILIFLEIISYLCVLWGKDNSVLLLFLGMYSIREKD